MSLIIKGAVVMPEELFTEVLSVSWELLLEWDYQVTSAAGIDFYLACLSSLISCVYKVCFLEFFFHSTSYTQLIKSKNY